MKTKNSKIIRYFKYIFIFYFLFFIFPISAFAGLYCTMETSCGFSQVPVLKLYNLSNSHAELPSQNNYSYVVCCNGIVGLSNTCTGTHGVIARLSGDTNAHVEEYTQSTATYNGHDVCISVPETGTVRIGYQDNNCSGYDTSIASMSNNPTNAHVGDENAYPRKICASATPALQNHHGFIAPSVQPKPAPSEMFKIADFNDDEHINILDLSMMLYYFGNDSGFGGLAGKYDLNKDGRVDILDVSILFYYWDAK